MMKKNKWKLFILILFAVSAATIFSKTKRTSHDEIIQILNPAYGNIQVSVSATGIVQPQNRLEIKPPINGRIEEILVKEGDNVKAGQIIAWMSSTERAALLDAARAQGEDSVNYWKDVYKPTPLVSPIDGEIIVCTDQPGQTVTSSDVVVVLSDHLIVQAQIDETDIGRVAAGQDAFISLDAYPEIKVNGKVNHIYYESKIVNNVTIYQVDILPETVPAVFRSGMSATVNIIEKNKNNVLLLPVSAVKKGRDGSYVLLSQNAGEKPIERKVELGISDENNVEIVSGISAQDKVLITSQKYSLSSETKAKVNPFMPMRRRDSQSR